jgi:SAM-dependent methyltransferase
MHAVDGRDLMICEACRHVFWRDMPSDDVLRAFYAGSYTAEHDQITQQEQNRAYYRSHVDELSAIIGRRVADLTFVDVGCSYPVFLAQAVRAGVRGALGVDWSPEAREYGQRHGVDVIRPDEFDARMPDGSVDLLRYSHTLEHLIDPVSVLASHLPKLAPGGVVYVTQPCIPVLRFAASPAPPHDAVWPTHLHFFSPLSMLALMRQFGLEVERFFTVADEDLAQARYGAALAVDDARTSLVELDNKGDPSRGALNNFPFFTGRNLAIYARRPDGPVKTTGRVGADRNRAPRRPDLRRRLVEGIARLLRDRGTP